MVGEGQMILSSQEHHPLIEMWKVMIEVDVLVLDSLLSLTSSIATQLSGVSMMDHLLGIDWMRHKF